MLDRYISNRVKTALSDTPVVLINGPRQSGKTTFVQALKPDWQYITFDDEAQLELARFDPVGFVNRLPDHVILDEVQRIPEIFRTIKLSVDNNRKPGRFLMTGSANILMLPKLSDSLAGRIETIALHPLSQCEIEQSRPSFVNMMFESKYPQSKQKPLREELIERILRGGYPEAVFRNDELRRQQWHRKYLETLIQRDIKEISQLEKLDQLPKVLSSMANHTGQLLNKASLATLVGVSRTTIDRMLKLLDGIFLTNELDAWHNNRHLRLSKSNKVHVCDTGLACALLKISSKALTQDRKLLGQLLETFIFNELKQQANWDERFIDFYHFRDARKREVDIILEFESGLYCIEVKAAETIQAKDFRTMKLLKENMNDKFKSGVVLYDGESVIVFGDDLFAVPISLLWQ